MSREYASVSPDKWRSKTGRQLRGDPWAMVIQDYLITCPLSEMTGAYYLPKCMIIAETGINPSELDRVMVKLQELDFCRYYEEDEYIFVRNMARYQISQTLNERDNRRAKVRKDLERLPEDVREDFIREYNVNFNLGYTIHEDTQATQKKSRNKIQTPRRTASSEHDYAPDFGAASAAISGSKTHQRNGAELSEIEEVSDSFINKGLKPEEIGGLDRGFSDSNNSLGRGFEGASEGLNESKQAPSKPGTGTGTGELINVASQHMPAEEKAPSADLPPDAPQQETLTLNSDAGAEVTPAYRAQQVGKHCPQQKIIDLYHECLPTLTRVRMWNTAKRKQMMAARWREMAKDQEFQSEAEGLDFFRRFFEFVSHSPFLMGQAKTVDGRSWRADLEWLLKSDNFTKVCERRYHNG